MIINVEYLLYCYKKEIIDETQDINRRRQQTPC